MELFPPMPSWEAAHPLVVHFPIALILVAWVPMVVGLVDVRRRWAWMGAGLLLLVMGTAGAFIAVLSGEATEDKVVVTSELIERAIHEHEEAGEMARTLAVAATAMFVVALGLGAGMKKGRGRTLAVGVAAVVFAGVYGLCAQRLAWAGHRGGELVHAYGVRAPMVAPPVSPDVRGRDEDD